MELVYPEMISLIDAYAEQNLGIPVRTLMGRSGEAVANAVRALSTKSSRVLFLCGKGNNGGDGYAAACLLSDLQVAICDVFSAGQRTEAGKFYLEEYKSAGGRFVSLPECASLAAELSAADVIVDAVFGTGFSGEIPQILSELISACNASPAHRIAVDVPLGVNAADGSVLDTVFRAEATVALSYSKPGLHSYPAKEFVGRVSVDDIGISRDSVRELLKQDCYLTDMDFARDTLPERPENSNKGSFGRTLLVTGSDEYRGAAHLALEAALRGGAGLVRQIGAGELCAELRAKFPEALYTELDINHRLDAVKILSLAEKSDTVLLGSGCGVSESLSELAAALIEREGGPLILDADAINSIARYGSADLLLRSRRTVVLTPHPLEFSRLSGITLEYVQAHRLECAKNFAEKYGVILLLKGAATVITDGRRVYLNSSGSQALAKGGTGDVLAGLCAAQLIKASDALAATALCAYLHGRAAEELECELSGFAVTASDLPKQIGRVISDFCVKRKELTL